MWVTFHIQLTKNPNTARENVIKALAFNHLGNAVTCNESTWIIPHEFIKVIDWHHQDTHGSGDSDSSSKFSSVNDRPGEGLSSIDREMFGILIMKNKSSLLILWKVHERVDVSPFQNVWMFSHHVSLRARQEFSGIRSSTVRPSTKKPKPNHSSYISTADNFPLLSLLTFIIYVMRSIREKSALFNSSEAVVEVSGLVTTEKIVLSSRTVDIFCSSYRCLPPLQSYKPLSVSLSLNLTLSWKQSTALADSAKAQFIWVLEMTRNPTSANLPSKNLHIWVIIILFLCFTLILNNYYQFDNITFFLEPTPFFIILSYQSAPPITHVSNS